MGIALKDIITLVKELPETYLEEAFEKLAEIKQKANDEKEPEKPVCPCCKSENISRNGKNRGKQVYLCRDCTKNFTETSATEITYFQRKAVGNS